MRAREAWALAEAAAMVVAWVGTAVAERGEGVMDADLEEGWLAQARGAVA